MITPAGVIMTYGIRRGPVPICARLDYVRTPDVLRDRQSFQRRDPSRGALFGRAGDFWFGVTGFAFAVPSLAPSSLSASNSPSIPAGYDQYTNARYGFTTLWPASLQIQAQPADNDGQKWASPDGQVQMLAFGSNNTHNYSPRQDEAAAAQRMSVTYANVSGNMVTVSGYMNNQQTIIYRRDVVGPGAIDTLYWSYPASQKTKWDAAVTLTALSFRPGNLDITH